MNFSGRNVNRDIGAPGIGHRTIGDDLRRIRTEGQPPTLQRAVVLDVIMDPNLLGTEYLEDIRNTVNNPQFVDVLPVNSIIARMTSEAQGSVVNMNTILFPIFSSHFLLPIQPGEIVEVIFEDFYGNGNVLGYWISRTCSERTIEDVNYTHYDRRFDSSMNPRNYSTQQRSERDTNQPGPGFPNGGNTPETFTLGVSSSQDAPYERIINNATAYFSGTNQIVTIEPIPRWRKRPQEFVLQGANNTLICLGEDRKGGPLGAFSEENPDAKLQAGTIDMVVGRGRYLPSNPDDSPEEQISDSDRSSTSPLITTNTRDKIETNKAPYRRIPGQSRLGDNPVEGDPDFLQDAARIYVTMQSEIDVNFGISELNFTENSLHDGDNKNEIPQPNSGESGTANKSYVLGKADHIRLIARKDEGRTIEGTLLLMREGGAEADLDVIYLDKNGVHIDGPSIILGRGLAEVAGEGGSPTPGGEPYIRWSKYRDTIDRLQEEIGDLKDALKERDNKIQEKFNNLTTILQAAFANAIAAPYSPIAALSAIAVNVGNLGTQLGSDLGPPGTNADNAVTNGTEDTTNFVNDSKSTKIFGE